MSEVEPCAQMASARAEGRARRGRQRARSGEPARTRRGTRGPLARPHAAGADGSAARERVRPVRRRQEQPREQVRRQSKRNLQEQAEHERRLENDPDDGATMNQPLEVLLQRKREGR